MAKPFATVPEYLKEERRPRLLEVKATLLMYEVAVYPSLFSISGSNLGKKALVVKWDPCQYAEWTETEVIDTSYFITCKFA